LDTESNNVNRLLIAKGLRALGWPLAVAGGVKILYDLLRLAPFGKIRPPEEDKRH